MISKNICYSFMGQEWIIQTKLAENGSPRAVFETTNDHLTFLVTIPVHKECTNSSETGSETIFKSSETSSGTQPKSSGTPQKTLDKILELIKMSQR